MYCKFTRYLTYTLILPITARADFRREDSPPNLLPQRPGTDHHRPTQSPAPLAPLPSSPPPPLPPQPLPWAKRALYPPSLEQLLDPAMSESDEGRIRVASVGELDEKSGKLDRSTMRYATSVAASPRKETSNTGRYLRRAPQADSSSQVSASGHTDSDSTLHPSLDRRHSTRNGKEREKHQDKDRERDRRAVVSMQPAPAKRSATAAPRGASRDQDSRYFGVPSPVTMTAAPASPRHTRQPRHPMPPPANNRFYAPSVPAPQAMPYSPPTWVAPGHFTGYTVQPQPLVTPRPLEDRFGANPARPKSAMAQRLNRQPPYENTHDGAMAVVRRGSTSKRYSKIEMAPPGRPGSARPTATSPFARPPPPHLAGKAVGFEEDDLDGDSDLFNDLSPQPRRTYTPTSPSVRSRSRPRRPSVDARSHTYDGVTLRTEVTGPSSRRQLYYGERHAPASGGLEDQIKMAKTYQQDVDGAANLPLTDGNLRKASRHGGSSRSTRSSGSHESEYRRSATTRTTRSSADNEDVTIRVKGHTTLMVGGAEMHCQDGAEINISQRGGGAGGVAAYRRGSDESSYLDQDDGRTRMDRALGGPRTRASSQAGSYSRPSSYSVYDPRANPFGTGPYDVAPSYHSNYGYAQVPPYPAYPGTGSYESARGGYL